MLLHKAVPTPVLLVIMEEKNRGEEDPEQQKWRPERCRHEAENASSDDDSIGRPPSAWGGT